MAKCRGEKLEVVEDDGVPVGVKREKGEGPGIDGGVVVVVMIISGSGSDRGRHGHRGREEVVAMKRV